MPKAIDPVKLIIFINSLKPKRKRPKGRKQAKAQAICSEKPKSCQRIFLKVKPKAIKEVKQVITPKIKPNFIISPPMARLNPEIASSETIGFEAPKTMKINKR